MVIVCNNGYYLKSDLCEPCTTNTAVCDANGDAITCKDNYFLKDKRCNSTCTDTHAAMCTETATISCLVGFEIVGTGKDCT